MKGVAGFVTLFAIGSNGAFVGKLSSLSKYPGYTGDVAVAVDGDVWVTYGTDSVNLKGSLSGLSASGSGGIHIHAGSSCDTAGPHYWEGTGADPWTTTYTSDADGKASLDVTASPYNDLSIKSTGGRVVVIHDTNEAKTRIACGVIQDASETGFAAGKLSLYPGFDGATAKGKLSAYPGFDSDDKVEGTFSLNADNVFKFTVTGYGLYPGGVHIHSGMTCDTHEEISGHHWNATGNDASLDPWKLPQFTWVNGTEQEIDLKPLAHALTFEENVNHVVVVHNASGTRVACGQLLYVPNAEGYVKAYEKDGKLVVAGWAQGVQPINGETGGVHVHSGTTCDDASKVGGHFLIGDVDPWKEHKYTIATTAQGTSTRARSYFKFETDSQPTMNLGNVTGKAYVVHASDGTRILCGTLGAKAGETVPSPSPSPGDNAATSSVVSSILFIASFFFAMN